MVLAWVKNIRKKKKVFTLSPALWIFVFILNQISLNLFIIEKIRKNIVMYDNKWNSRECEKSGKKGRQGEKIR